MSIDMVKPVTPYLALGAYFQALRDMQRTSNGRKVSRARLAVQLTDFLGHEIDPSTIYRIEVGTQMPGGELLAALIGVLGGRIEDVIWCVQNPTATAEEGRHRALATLASEIETEKELEALITGWKTDRGLRQSIRRALIEHSSSHANGDVDP